jgi:hypothetical protein
MGLSKDAVKLGVTAEACFECGLDHVALPASAVDFHEQAKALLLAKRDQGHAGLMLEKAGEA